MQRSLHAGRAESTALALPPTLANLAVRGDVIGSRCTSRNSEDSLQTECMRCPEAYVVFQVQVHVNLVERRAAKSTEMHLYGVACVGRSS
jgi:hypothetical protein